jgi:hypothetical protein
MAARYLKAEATNLFSDTKLIFEKALKEKAYQIGEDQELYQVNPTRKKMM